MFVQAIYESRITENFGPLVILGLQKASITRNRECGLTSFLYHDEYQIFQLIEGEQQQVSQLLARIEASDLHYNMKVRAMLNIAERSFPRWYFGATNNKDTHFKRAYNVLAKPSFFNLDVLEAVNILKMVASRKRRAIRMDEFSVKARNFRWIRHPHPLQSSG